METLPIILMLLGASVVSVILFRRLNLPPVLGYLLVGALIGPHAFNLVEGFSGAQHLAEFGVVFLMFSIGLEFSLAKLYAMKRIVFGLGFLQVLATLLAVTGIVTGLGLSWQAGVALGGRFEETHPADIDWLMDVNLHAVMRLTHACLPLLRAEPQAQIVNLSSVFGIIAPAGQAAYAASKFAMRGFTEALRHEFEGTGLGVTLVHPGGVATAIARNARTPRAMDPRAAAEGLAAFERLLTLRPEAAAAAILRGIEARAPRVVIGADARRALLIQRLMPVRYWSLIRRAVRDT